VCVDDVYDGTCTHLFDAAREPGAINMGCCSSPNIDQIDHRWPSKLKGLMLELLDSIIDYALQL